MTSPASSIKEMDDSVESITNSTRKLEITNADDADTAPSSPVFNMKEREAHPRVPINQEPEVLHTNTGCLQQLPVQREKIVKRKGVAFTMMVVGESGVGKTTFVNTLFRDQVKDATISRSVEDRIEGKPYQKSTKLDIKQVEYEENGFVGTFTIVESRGFGDFTNNKSAWLPLCQYIDAQHALYMCEEEQPYRDELVDTRVHVCLYFIYPSGHGLLPLDIVTMQELSQRVNLIPVVAKADCFSKEDLEKFKQSIRHAVLEHEISVFAPPQSWTPDGQDPVWPYSIIASEKKVEVNGKEHRGRQYRWGVSLVDDAEHCDFVSLSEVLMSRNMLDLIDATHETHYERQRRFLMQERFKASEKLHQKEKEPEGSLNTLSKASKDKKSVTFMSPVVAGNEGAGISAFSSLELLARISPFGYEYLRNQRLEHNALFIQRVRCAQEDMARVSALQEVQFKKWNEELRRAKESCQNEIDSLYREVDALQHQLGTVDHRRRH